MEKPDQHWGKLLKYFRQKKKLKQDDVAFGICTPSYLSRIENELVIADYTLYEQLFNNLGISLSHLQQDLEIQSNLLETIYAKLLANILLDTEEIKQLQALQQNEQSLELQIIAKLIYSRYLYSLKDDVQARLLLDEIKPLVRWQKDRITELYVAITAYGHLSFLEFEQLAQKEQRYGHAYFLTNAHPFEQANYHYHLAFANHRSYNLQKAVEHIDLAVHHFSYQYKPLFQLKLYSMKGVIYNDLHRFQKALQEFNAGLELLENVTAIQSPMQWSSIHNNIAYCYECQHNFQMAHEHYQIANTYDEDLHSVINWMRTCYQHNDFVQLKTLLARYEAQEFIIPHHIYQRRLLEYAICEDHTIRALKDIEETIFPYFNDQHYYSLTLFYAPLWGQFYEHLHAYKQANQCFKLALTASEKVRQRMSR